MVMSWFSSMSRSAGRGQLPVDLRIALVELGQMPRDLVHGQCRWAQHTQMAAHLGGGRLRQQLRLVHLGQDAPRTLQIGLANLGQREGCVVRYSLP